MTTLHRRALCLGAVAAAMGVVATTAGCTSSKPVLAAVRIGPAPVEFRVEIAETAEQQRNGLGGLDELSAGTGMLFRFGHRGEQQVWMAGMKMPLDIAWIADGKVVAIDTLAPCAEADPNACPRWTSPSPVDALLEVPAHSLNAVVPGMTVTIEAKRDSDGMTEMGVGRAIDSLSWTLTCGTMPREGASRCKN